METESLECRVFRKEYKSLHTGIRQTVDTVVQTAFSNLLIPEDIHNIASNPAGGLTREARTTTFLNAVQDRIKLKPIALRSFIEILEYEKYTEILAERLNEALKSESEAMTEEREKRAQQQQHVVSASARATQNISMTGSYNSSAFVSQSQQFPTSSNMPGDDLIFSSNFQASSQLLPSSTVGSEAQPPKSLRFTQTTAESRKSSLVAGSPILIWSRNHTGNYSSMYRGGSFSGPAAAHVNSSPHALFEEANSITKRAMSPLVFAGTVTSRNHSQQTTPLQTRQFTGFLSHVLPGNTMQHYIIQKPESGSASSNEPSITLPEKEHPQLENNICALKIAQTQSECLPTADEYHSTGELPVNNDLSFETTPQHHVIVHQPVNDMPTNHEEHPQSCPKVEQTIIVRDTSATASQLVHQDKLKGTFKPSLTAEVELKQTGDIPNSSLAPNCQGSVESSISSTYGTPPSSPVEDCGVNPIQESQTSLDDKEYTKLVAPSGPGAVSATEDQQISTTKCKPCVKCAELQHEIDGLSEDLRTLKRTFSQSKDAQDSQVTELMKQLFAYQQENYRLNATVDDQERRHSQAANEIAALQQNVQQLMSNNQQLKLNNQQLQAEVVNVKAKAFDYRIQNDVDQQHIADLTKQLLRVNSMQCSVVYEQDPLIQGETVNVTTDDNIEYF